MTGAEVQRAKPPLGLMRAQAEKDDFAGIENRLGVEGSGGATADQFG